MPSISRETKKPNLLIVFADQMRAMDMGCAGNEQVKTPNLDKLAGEGAMFTNAVSTCAVCGPHRAMMLTGLYPLSNTVFTNNIRLPDDVPALGDMLQKRGYDTAYIGKWHLAGEPAGQGFVPPGPMRHGFDYWAVHNCSHKYYDSVYFADSPAPVVMPGWQPDRQTELAMDYIKNHAGAPAAGKKPFAMVMSWGPPHTPFIAPPEYVSLYPPDQIKLRPNIGESCDWMGTSDSPIPDKFKDWWNSHRDAGRVAFGREAEELLREFISNYYAAITNLDWNMGRLMALLAELNIVDDTLVVFTSDHGEMLGSHGQLHKWQPWDESILVPFILRLPRQVAGGTRPDFPFGTPDILPTLFGLMGLDVPANVEGRDLAGLLRSPPAGQPAPSSALIACICAATTWGQKWSRKTDRLGRIRGNGMAEGFYRPYRGIRTATHTYVRDRQGPWFLFDNVNDPYQLNNLAATGGAAAVPPEFERELQDWLERTGDYFGANADYQKLVDLATGMVVDRQALKVK